MSDKLHGTGCAPTDEEIARNRDFPHRVDALRGDVQWVATNVPRLRAATFLDGRVTFWSDPRIESLADRPAPEAPLPGMIFHPGFCGSTLLARMLDRPGTTLVLREPQALADIASQAPQISPARLDEALRWTLAHLSAMAPAGEVLVIKPSNWINGLAPALAAGGHIGRALFLTMQPAAFLRACFRGGRDRLAHCLRLAELLAPQMEGGTALMQSAIGDAQDPLDRAALLVVLAHHFQSRLLLDARAMLPAGHTICIDHAELSADPHSAAQSAAAVLGLPSPGAPTAEFDPARHAKDAGRGFSAQTEAEANLQVEAHHAGRFAMALAWLEKRSTVAASR